MNDQELQNLKTTVDHLDQTVDDLKLSNTALTILAEEMLRALIKHSPGAAGELQVRLREVVGAAGATGHEYPATLSDLLERQTTRELRQSLDLDPA